MQQQYISNHQYQYLFNNSQVQMFLANTLLNIEGGVTDLTEHFDYEYHEHKTDFTINKSVFTSLMYSKDENDPLANIEDFVSDSIKLHLETKNTKLRVQIIVKNAFSYIDIISDVLMQQNRARKLSINEACYAPIIASAIAGTPLPNTNNSNPILKIDATADILNFSSLTDTFAAISEKGIDMNDRVCLLDPYSYMNLQKDIRFRNLEYVGREGAVNTPYLYDPVLGLKYISIQPSFTYPKGGNAKGKEVIHKLKKDPTKAFCIMAHRNAIHLRESDLMSLFESAPVSQDGNLYELQHNFGVAFSNPEGIAVIESLKQK